MNRFILAAMKIRNLLLIITLGISTLALAIILLTAYQASREVIEKSIRNSLEQKAVVAIGTVDLYINSLLRDLNSWASKDVLQEVATNHQNNRNISLYIGQLAKERPYLLKIMALNRQGIIISTSSVKPENENMATTPFFQAAMAGREYVGSAEFEQSQGQWIIKNSVAIHDQQNPSHILGVLYIEWRISQLDTVLQLSAYDTSQAVNLLIANQDGTAILVKNQAILGLLQANPADRIVGTGKPIKNSITGKLGWTAIVSQDRASAFLPAKALNNQIMLVGLLCVLVLAGSSSFLGSRLAEPIITLSEAAATVAQGQLDIEVQYNHHNEIGGLFNSFNQMVKDLKVQRDRILSDQKLISSTLYVNSILDSMNDALWVIKANGEIITSNTVAKQGYRTSTRQPASFDDLLSSTDFTAVIAALNSFGLFRGDLALVSATGLNIPVSFSASFIRRDDGAREEIVCVAQDISEREIAAKELRDYAAKLKESNMALTDFAHVASHDLQEPLRKIRAFGSRLQDETAKAGTAEGKLYLEKILSSAEKMQVLIGEILNFSRITTKAQPFERIELAEVVSEVLSNLESQLERSGGEVQIGELCAIDADATQMRQLVQNLISNALKFHREDVKPVIKISSTVKGSDCELVVQDNGIGFEQKYADKIFVMFQRLNTRDQYEGSGVGLAICKKIAERHNGNISVKSVLNEGTTFTIRLPIHQASPLRI